MKDLMRDLQQQEGGNEPGRARRRKIQRESGMGTPAMPDAVSGERKTTRPRPSRQSGPSSREQQVQGQIHSQADGSEPIEGMLKSRLNRGGRSRRSEAGSRSRRTEELFTATQHAETQRITSHEQGYLPARNRRTFDAHSDAEPPVLVRGGMGGMAFGRVANSRLHKSRTPRRRIDVPLRVPGAEVRLPSIPFINLGWRSISLSMVIFMTICLVAMWKAPMFQVSGVDARGLKRLTATDLNAVMGTVGKSIFSLDPVELRRSLSQAFPEFSKISVRVGLPASVKVVVTERQPVISWTQDGVESWVDADGVSFPVRGVVDTPLVVVEGYGTPPGTVQLVPADAQAAAAPMLPASGLTAPSMRLSPELVSSILALGAKMPAETALVYDSQRGLGWNDPNGWEVFFGDENQDMQMKLEVYQSLVERLKSEGIQPALISVEYVHAPYYRMER